MLVCHLARSAAVAALVASLTAFSDSDRPAALRVSSSVWAAFSASWASLAVLRSAAMAFFPASPSASVSPVAGVAVAGVGSDAGLTGVVWAGVAPAAAGIAPARSGRFGHGGPSCLLAQVLNGRPASSAPRRAREPAGLRCRRGRGEPLPDEGDLARREAELLPDDLLGMPSAFHLVIASVCVASVRLSGSFQMISAPRSLAARVVTEREVEPEDLLPGLALVELRVADLGDEARSRRDFRDSPDGGWPDCGRR